VPDIKCFQDDASGFFGPLMGMKSAWSHVKADYVLFIPCDVTYIPTQVIAKLHSALRKNKQANAYFQTLAWNQKCIYFLHDYLFNQLEESLIVLTKWTELQSFSIFQQLMLMYGEDILHIEVLSFDKTRRIFYLDTTVDAERNLTKANSSNKTGEMYPAMEGYERKHWKGQILSSLKASLSIISFRLSHIYLTSLPVYDRDVFENTILIKSHEAKLIFRPIH
jgi:hypothetical protein